MTRRAAPDRQAVKEEIHGEEDRDLYGRESGARRSLYLLAVWFYEAESHTQITAAYSVCNVFLRIMSQIRYFQLNYSEYLEH